jgi:hypothetical protein
MKNPKTTAALVGLGLVLVLSFGYAQGNPRSNNSINTFINNTGQAVGGLHIQYNSTGYFFIYQNPPTFGNVQNDGTAINLSSGTVAAGGSFQITISNPAGTHERVQKWWWTDGNGILVGKTHNGCTNPDCTSP